MFVQVELTEAEWEQIQAQRLSVGFAEALADEMDEELLKEAKLLIFKDEVAKMGVEQTENVAFDEILDED